MESAWAQLVSVTDIESAVILVIKDKFVVGRNSDCDLAHAGNKLVSGNHCYIERDGNGQAWLYDTSTNGTLLNLSIKLNKGECRELHHGDEIHIVHKKNDTEDDIGYMFQDMEALGAESSSDLEDTQEYTEIMNDLDTTLPDQDVNTVSTPSPLKKRKSTEISPVVDKTIKIDSQLTELSCPTGEEQKNTDVVTDSPDKGPYETKKISSAFKAKQQVAGKSEEKIETIPASKSVISQEPEEDALAETLVCIICQELLYDCISLQPCMHTFCGGCYSEWMERSQECPSCRLTVVRINKNHIVNNLVDAYLKTRPEKKRPEADLKELDGKNKITRDMLYPAEQLKGHSDESCSDSYTDEEEGPFNAGAAPPPAFPNFNQGGLVFGLGTPFYGIARPEQTVCRQCRRYRDQQNVVAIDPTLQGAAATNDPDAKTFPTPADYLCPPNGNHVLCQCCMQPMPDRRNQYVNGGEMLPQQCYLCLRPFCHAYWGCHSPDCNGCLAQFKDLNFGKKCLTHIVLENHYESKVLADYMAVFEMSVNDLFKECLNKATTGEYRFSNQARLTALYGFNTPVCNRCGLQAFRELAYFYRQDIPVGILPKEVTKRPNCYWGSNCRTQRNRPEHATRYNHICYPSRTNR